MIKWPEVERVLLVATHVLEALAEETPSDGFVDQRFIALWLENSPDSPYRGHPLSHEVLMALEEFVSDGLLEWNDRKTAVRIVPKMEN